MHAYITYIHISAPESPILTHGKVCQEDQKLLLKIELNLLCTSARLIGANIFVNL
jgi:hypothetical protein